MNNLGDMTLLFGELGESDCEQIGDGLLNQPVNALSSSAYTLFGIWLVWRAVRSRGEDRPIEIFYGLALASVGIGSIAFHGPVPPGARLLHDLTIAAVLAVIAARNLGVLAGWGHRQIIASAVLTIVVVGSVMTLAPDLGNLLTGVVGVVAVATEVLVYRQGHRRFSRRLGRLLVATVLLLVVAGIINVLGRTGGLLCDPDSYFQGHALWHVLTAGAFMVYGYAAFAAAPD